MTKYLMVLGRQPALGLAELESLYGAAAVQPVGRQTAIVDAPVGLQLLGGSVKSCQLLTVLDATDWPTIERAIRDDITPQIAALPEGKLQIGLSAYGFHITPERITAAGLNLKKALKKSNRSVRLSPNQSPALTSAQVYHNHLTGPQGWELVIAQDDHQTILARTVAIQDIASYTLRDRGRPKRDARIGMLPPKLAQIIINLAVGKPPRQPTVLDPFCGTGVILQESLLVGYNAYGTDLEGRMVDYSGENLDWLDTQLPLGEVTMRIEQGDATTYTWDRGSFDTVASESYLGRPLTTLPDRGTLEQTIADCNLIVKKFLHNLVTQTQPGFRLCLAIPAWQVRNNEFKHLPLVDRIGDLGYNRISFEHVDYDQLLYYREDQIVARQLLVLTRK